MECVGGVCIRHGSSDSKDIDIVYLVSDHLPSAKDFSRLCEEEQKRQKNVDLNVALVRNGHVVDCIRGVPSELNNALLRTAPLHPENEDEEKKKQLSLLQPVERSVGEKFVCTLQKITIMLRRHARHRDRCIKMLKSNSAHDMWHWLRDDVDWRQDHEECDLDDVKQVAFMLGQTLSMQQGESEWYTKKELCEAHPSLTPYLMRHDNITDWSPLQIVSDKVCSLMLNIWQRGEEVVTLQHRSRHDSISTIEVSLLKFQKNYTRALAHMVVEENHPQEKIFLCKDVVQVSKVADRYVAKWITSKKVPSTSSLAWSSSVEF